MHDPIYMKNKSRACVYLVIFLLLTEGHQDDRDKQIQHHKCHKNYAGPNEEGTKNWAVVQDLPGRKPVIPFFVATVPLRSPQQQIRSSELNRIREMPSVQYWECDLSSPELAQKGYGLHPCPSLLPLKVGTISS